MRLFFIWPWVTSARANMYGLKINRIPQIGYTFIQMRLTWVSYCTYVSQWCILKWNIERWKTSQFCFLLFPPLCYGLEVNSEKHFKSGILCSRVWVWDQNPSRLFSDHAESLHFLSSIIFFFKQIRTTSASLQRQRVVYQRPFVCCCASLLIVVAKLPRQKWMTER